jgi:hypothetical protein
MEKKLYGAIYIENRKILLCKSEYFKKITIPLKYDEYAKFETMLKNEFGIFPFLTKLYKEYEVPVIINGEYINTNIHPFKIEEYPDYTLKEEIEIDESGEYTEKDYYSYSEALNMYNEDKISENTFNIILLLKKEGVLD